MRKLIEVPGPRGIIYFTAARTELRRKNYPSFNGAMSCLNRKNLESSEQGRFADFHALRYTWSTLMRRNGVSDNFAREQMGHQTVRQTDADTDEAQLPIDDSIKNLPRLGGDAQIRAQLSGSEGQNVTPAGALRVGSESDKTLVNIEVCRGVTLRDAGMEMERAKGFEPSTFTLAT